MNHSDLTDLIDKAISGDTSVYSELYEQTCNQVYFFALNLLHSKESAEDITQETFITVFDKINTLQDPHAYRSWVNQIALNKIRRYTGKNQELLLDNEEEGFKFDNVEEEDELYLPEGSLDNAETRKMIMDLINRLPDAQKTVVLMYYYEQMSVSQIAEAMECSEGTVKSRLNYARKEIKAGVEGYEKKGIKLYSLGSVPMLLLLLDLLAKENAISPIKAKALFDSVISATQAASTVGSAGAATSLHSANSIYSIEHAKITASHIKLLPKKLAGKFASASLKSKIVSVAVAAAVVATPTAILVHNMAVNSDPVRQFATEYFNVEKQHEWKRMLDFVDVNYFLKKGYTEKDFEDNSSGKDLQEFYKILSITQSGDVYVIKYHYNSISPLGSNDYPMDFELKIKKINGVYKIIYDNFY